MDFSQSKIHQVSSGHLNGKFNSDEQPQPQNANENKHDVLKLRCLSPRTTNDWQTKLWNVEMRVGGLFSFTRHSCSAQSVMQWIWENRRWDLI